MMRFLLRAFRVKVLFSHASGQVSVEAMLLLAVVTIAMVLAFFLVVPGIRDGFVALAEKIIAENP
jgi:uncharacterized protein (UPF0333 family)